MSDLIIELINKIIIAILASIFTFFALKIVDFLKKRKLIYILNLRKSNSGIFIPVRNREIKTAIDNVYESSSVYQDDLVIYNEVLILYEVKKLIDEIGKKSTLEIYKDRASFHTNNNAFYFGGYEAHEYVRDVFVEKFPMIRFTCLEETYNKWKDVKIKKILEISQDTNKRHIKLDGEEILEYDASKDEGYIVMIKRTGKTDLEVQNMERNIFVLRYSFPH